MESIKFFIIYCSIPSYVYYITWINSSNDWQTILSSLFLIIAHKCSIGFISQDLAGHHRSPHILCSRMNYLVILAECDDALAYCIIKSNYSNRGRASYLITWIYFSAFTYSLLAKKYKSVLSSKKILPHTKIENFTIGSLQLKYLGSIGSPGILSTLWVIFLRYYIVDSSVNITWCQ